jgi:hypothetical protein
MFTQVLYSPAPAMWLLPIPRAELNPAPHYACPLYRTVRSSLAPFGVCLDG